MKLLNTNYQPRRGVPFIVTIFCRKALVPGTFAVPPLRRRMIPAITPTRAGTREVYHLLGDPEFLGAVGTIGREKVPVVRGFQ